MAYLSLQHRLHIPLASLRSPGPLLLISQPVFAAAPQAFILLLRGQKTPVLVKARATRAPPVLRRWSHFLPLIVHPHPCTAKPQRHKTEPVCFPFPSENKTLSAFCACVKEKGKYNEDTSRVQQRFELSVAVVEVEVEVGEPRVTGNK